LERQRSPFLMAYLRAVPSGPRDDAPRFQATLQFNGDWSAQLDRQDLVLRGLDDSSVITITLRALRADIGYAARLPALAVRAAAERGDLGNDGVHAQLIDLAMLGEYRLDSSGWLFGDTSLRVASIVHSPTQGRVSGFELAASSTENGASAAASIALRAESSEFLERDFGGVELDATARNVSLSGLRSWFHRSDSFSARALQSLSANANLRLSRLTIRDREGASLVRARATARIAPAETSHDTRLSLDLSASRAFSEFVFWHGAKRTLGRSALFGELNELDDAEQSAVARTSATKQLSVLAARGYLTWNRGWYHTRVTLDAGKWALNGRPVNVR
ncbi:MAG: YdgA family protein, partial [Gammaproteobacteria bacterium]|nr:YdgA family protein [Gammaproteobacteria bacterium]